MNDEKKAPAKIEITLTDGAVTIEEVATGIAKLEPQQFLEAVRAIVEAGHADQMREVLDAIEIMSTPSAFAGDQVETLEEASQAYSFKWWLGQRDKSQNEATREDLMSWWDFFMTMCTARGYQPMGRINQGQSTNLWKATGNLAKKMLVVPAEYMYLPAILINNSEQVDKALQQIVDPRAFMEVLTGEAWEDMSKSDAFLTAFSTIEVEGAEGAIASVMLALQRT